MQFNPTVHETDEHGDGIRGENGEYRLRKNWKSVAVDKKGRKFNDKIHDGTLDDSGHLKVKRRDEARKPMTATQKLTDLVDQHREPGYSYRVVNDEGGRIQTFQKHDWEPVMGEDGIVRVPVGQARQPGTHAVLMKKPEEWYEEDQQEKERLLNVHTESQTAPQSGQYEPVGPDGQKLTKLR